MISEGRDAASTKGAPLVGFVSKFVTMTLPINQAGYIHAIAKIGDEEFVFASLNIQPATA